MADYNLPLTGGMLGTGDMVVLMRTVLRALCAVQKDLAAAGISKGDTNTFDNYKFRGIDAVLNALAPILSKHQVIIMPSVTSSEIRQVMSSQGKPQQHAKVSVEYTLYDAEGDHITHTFVGEGMDRGDKAINKACTAAYKYFLFEAFCIPVEGTPDADRESPEIIPDKPLEQCVEDLADSILAIKEGIESGDIASAAQCWFELDDEEKRSIWVAPSQIVDGKRVERPHAPFTTHERDVMKSQEFKTAFHGE